MLRALCLLALLPGGAGAQGLMDRHLPVIDRSARDAAAVAALLAPPTGFSRPEPFEALSGGGAGIPAQGGADAFSQPSANMSAAGHVVFAEGRRLFRKLWLASPAPVPAADGLGPLYNARSCQACHVNDGRAPVTAGPEPGGGGLVLRLSVPGGDAPATIAGWLATRPDPVYGAQVQDRAAPGLRPEARVTVSYDEKPVVLADGTTIPLQVPRYGLADLAHGPLHPEAMLSARLAPPMIGLGLLEAIPAADILAREDPEDADGDGISGRAQIVIFAEDGLPMLGRFGLKAGSPTLRVQVAEAFALDMGLSSPLHPAPYGDCTPAQANCRAAPHGQDGAPPEDWEVDRQSLDAITFYARNLAVPQRRGVADPQVLAGKALFHGLACAACHTPRHMTHRLAGQAEQSFQLIWPYTDLLLHDMGEDLADNRPEGRATGREWKTPPLWGIGLAGAVNGQARFLHDGRARSLEEAILWHGGEARAARDGFAALSAEDRKALIAFLNSL